MTLSYREVVSYDVSIRLERPKIGRKWSDFDVLSRRDDVIWRRCQRACCALMAIIRIFVDQEGSWSDFDAVEGLIRLWRVHVEVAKRPCSESRQI